MNFNVSSATIDGITCQAGDEIGIFDGNQCVGFTVVTQPGDPIFIVASADDPLTPETDGFVAGDTVLIKIWDASAGTEITTLQVFIITGLLEFSEGGSTWLTIAATTPCTSPTPPVVGTITQPTCAMATANIALSGLPATGTWTLTQTPGGNTYTGTGATFTVTGLAAGITYSFTVANAEGCVSGSSGNAVVNAQPSTTASPEVGTITQPTCAVATASVALSGLPASGTWTLTRTPGGNTNSGTGTAYTVTGLPAGATYTFTVTNASGCISPASEPADINAQPSTPGAPETETVTQPTCQVTTGSVALSHLPASGMWTLTTIPTGKTYTGSGRTFTATGLQAGTTFTFRVTNADGCTSPASDAVTLNNPPSPPAPPAIATVTQPTCQLATGSIALYGLPSSGTWTLTRVPGGTTSTGSGSRFTVAGLPSGTYAFTVTNAAGCTSGLSSVVTLNMQPVTPGNPVIGAVTQPNCQVNTGSVVLTGLPETEGWMLTQSPGGDTWIGSGSSFTVTGLEEGTTYSFKVKNSAGCSSANSAGVVINAHGGVPGTPSVGNITQPTCTVTTGSVMLSSLPSEGNWTITRIPGGNTVNGSGSSTTLTNLPAGSYTFTLTNFSGCTSLPSATVTLQASTPPGTPNAVTIIQPDCSTPTGSVVLNNLPATGTWTLIRNPGEFLSVGSGTGTTVSGLAPGTYTFSVKNASGCTSSPSPGMAIAAQPLPAPPNVGTITQPTCLVSTGSVALSGLPSSGTWILTRSPGSFTISGSGTRTTVQQLAPGSYRFTVTNSSGCVSTPTEEVVIQQAANVPAAPVIGNIAQPSCSTATGAVLLVGLPQSGSYTLTRSPGNVTYSASGANYTVTGLAPATTYTFTVTTSGGCRSAASSPVAISPKPSVPGTPAVGTITDPNCSNPSGTVMLSGLPSGSWTLTKYPGGAIMPGNGASYALTDLSPGAYTFTVTNSSGCTSTATSTVTIHDAPPAPGAPQLGTITQPTCMVATGSVKLNGLPSGNWTLRRFPGSIALSGTGSSITVSGLNPGTHNFTVSDAAGCTSVSSAVAVIEEQPATPFPPVAVSISQPTCGLSTGSITFNNLPSAGSWTLVASPGGLIGTGKGSSATVSNLETATYTFYVSNEAGCTSGLSAEITILPQPSTPNAPQIGTVINPTNVSTGSVVLRGLPETGNWLLTKNPGGILTAGSGDTTVIKDLTAGTYYFSVTIDPGCTSEETMVYLPLVSGVMDQDRNMIRLFPNPVNTVLTVQVNLSGKHPATAELMTLQGILIRTEAVVLQDGRFELQAEDLLPGVYLLRVRYGESSGLLRFIKQ